MKKTFTIRSPDVISRLTAFLEAQPLEPILEVTIKLYQKDRNLAQNSLMWMWITIIGDEWGWTKDEVHNHFKKSHLVRIYERDDEGYAKMVQSIRRVYSQGFKDDANAMFEQIVRMTSTTSATVKQFTEYLNDIEKDMVSKGIALPHPEDRYYEAMGIKQN